jgi:hypothetical protein
MAPVKEVFSGLECARLAAIVRSQTFYCKHNYNLLKAHY